MTLIFFTAFYSTSRSSMLFVSCCVESAKSGVSLDAVSCALILMLDGSLMILLALLFEPTLFALGSRLRKFFLFT